MGRRTPAVRRGNGAGWRNEAVIFHPDNMHRAMRAGLIAQGVVVLVIFVIAPLIVWCLR